MKEANTIGVSSLVQPPESEEHGLPLPVPTLPSSRTRSLHVSLKSNEAEILSPQLIQPSEKERRGRLVSLGEKVGRLAHDIRNPLSSIEWFATLLGREQQSQEERQELANHCIQAVRSLDQLVSNMLVFSAPLEAQQEPIDLCSLVDDIELLAMYHLRKKRLTIHRRQDGQRSILNGHATLLKQALLNLLLNAIHASAPDSSIEMYSQKESRVLGEGKKERIVQGTVFCIRDDGCGMSDEDLSQIFRPFYSKRKGGTGLGLSIVQQIVQIHHGLIDITSHEGKGTTVEIFFPQ